jgi:hypothetical protein
MITRFAEGTFERIDRVLAKDETRTDFMRTAAEHEIELRKQARADARRKVKK